MESPIEPLLQGQDVPFERLHAALLEPLRDRQVPKLIQQIQSHFHSREDLERYSQSAKLVSAYALLYGTTNIPKWWQILSWIQAQNKEEMFQVPFVDMGCGPGSFSLAHKLFANACSFEGTSEYIFCDQSSLMLKQAEKFWESLGESNGRFVTPQSFGELKDQNPLLAFGHSLNEMGVSKGLNWVEKLNPRWVVVVEPGTSACFSEVLKFRQKLFERGYHILFPCAGSLTCPLAHEGLENEWCHQVLRTTFPGDLERLCQLSSLDRKVQPMIAHVYERKLPDPGNSLASFYRFLRETKHSFEWQVCLEEDGELRLKTFEIPKKTLSKSKKKQMVKMSTGGQFAYRVMKVLDDERIRVELVE